MSDKQRSISKENRISGAGLHTGHVVNLIFKPAGANEGIRFVRSDLPDKPSVKLGSFDIVHGGEGGRYSALKVGSGLIYTVEHMISALAGLRIDNITIEMDNDEAPGMDGSALPYVKAIKEAGIVEQGAERKYFEIKEQVSVSLDGASVMILPADEFKISYALEYPLPYLKQVITTHVTDDIFERELAPARTFCLYDEAEPIRAKGLGKGADFNNTLVFGNDGVMQNTLRFPDEAARHKILDCIGDLYLLGIPIKGHVIAFKSGHNLNRKLLKKIARQKAKYESKREIYRYEYQEGQEVDIQGIMRTMPHRYPFLLVDRILELKHGERAVGVKNVTINDGFFQGHFPDRPVMPGVLMVEAMAQVGGVCFLTKPELQGKLPLFMAVDNVKFRKVVEPGDQLIMEVDIVKARSRFAQAKGVCKVDGELACEAEMTFAFGE
jgi:UDP-3-O-[3-hydroxymyristoyl] N-acetylglucosamine deacetylase/3-hydroxyacyl-[acyl-carrier-protein] dehydratase